MPAGEIWHLELGGKVITPLRIDLYEFPWHHATVLDPAAFERFRPYFADPDTWPEGDPAFDQLLSEIKAAEITIRDLSRGEVHPEPLLWVDSPTDVHFRV
jgi:hypothetical protein